MNKNIVEYKKKTFPILTLILMLIIFTSGYVIGKNSIKANKEVPTTQQVKQEVKKEEVKSDQKQEVKKATAKEYTFENGNFICGKDFDPGTYDIVWVDGGGNVICMQNRVNQVMGSKDKNQEGIDMYKQEFKNATFKNGNKLELMNVKVKLVRVD